MEYKQYFFLILFHLHISKVESLKISGFAFKDNNATAPYIPANGQISVAFDETMPLEMSFCFKINMDFGRYGIDDYFFDFIDEFDENIVGVLVQFPFNSAKFNLEFYREQIFYHDDAARMNLMGKWTWLCFSMDLKDLDASKFYINGAEMEGKYVGTKTKNFVPPKKYKIRISKYPIDGRPLLGTYLDVNAWNRTLDREELRKYTDCKNTEIASGNLVNSKTRWLLNSSLIVPVSMEIEETQCLKENESFDLFLPGLWSDFKDASESCTKITSAGMGNAFDDENNYRKLYDKAQTLEGFVKQCWLGGRILIWLPFISPEASSDAITYKNYVTGKTPPNLWIDGGPSGTEGRVCMSAYLGKPWDKSIKDWPCERDVVWSLCAVCKIPNSLKNSTILYLRGLCKTTSFDNEFRVVNDDLGYVKYIGKRDTVITYSPARKIWEMTVVNDQQIMATAEASMSSLALGKHTWKIENDTPCQKENVEHILSFSSCENTQFICTDGLCIPGEKRCNGIKNCKDGSDEVGCTIVKTDNSYNMFLSPEPTLGNDFLVVKLSVNVLTVQEINEIESKFRVQYVLTLTWFDPRLVMRNLKERTESNTLKTNEKKNIWIPKLILANTDEQQSTVLDDDASLEVKRLGSYEISGTDSVDYDQHFHGRDNSISLGRFYNTIFDCKYDMAWYPFDTQKCSLIFQTEKESRMFVELEGEKLKYSGSTDLMLYFIKNKSIGQCTYRGIPSTCVEIVLGRRLLSVVLTTIVPTVLLLAISHLTNFFKDFFFEAVVTVNLTVMLVTTTMFVSISNKLPLTSYVKMIEIWMMFSLVVPFCEVLLHTYMDTLRNDDEREINHHGKSVNVAGVNTVKPFNPDLIARNEQIEVDAKKAYYQNLVIKKQGRLNTLRKIAVVYIPIFELAFMAVFWFSGMNQYNKD